MMLINHSITRVIAEEKEEEKRLAEKKVRYECGGSDEFKIYKAADCYQHPVDNYLLGRKDCTRTSPRQEFLDCSLMVN